MKLKKRLRSTLLIAVMMISVFAFSQMEASATCLYGIHNNGGYGITIDINSAPYTTFTGYSYGQYAYTASGCAWFASARARQLTGSGSTIWNGSGWWNGGNGRLGYSTGTTMSTTNKALVCYGTHISVLEGINSDGSIVISEGGYNVSSYANYGYCRIASVSKSYLESARGGSFLGYVYLPVALNPNGGTQNITVNYSSDTTDTPRRTVGTTTATMAATISVTGASISSVSTVGFELYNANGTALKSKTEKPTPKNNVINAWYGIGAGQEIDVELTSGTTYLYRFLAVINGQTYYGSFQNFTTVPIYVTGVTASPGSLTLTPGGSSTVYATVSPSDASIKSVNWSSSNENVATVINGTVTAINPGSAVIYATASDGSGKYGTCNVTVNPIRVTGINLSSTSGTILVNGTLKLSATITPSNATNKNVTWSSSDTNIASVDNSGNVRGIAPGTATIRCTAADGSGVYSNCTITVNKLVSSITLDNSSLELRAGETADLIATVLDLDASNRAVIWYSEDTDVASVDSDGTVTAVGPGITSIIASSADGSGVYAECIVVVSPAINAFELNKNRINIFRTGIGSQYVLGYTIDPEDQADAIVWESSNPSVAEVTQDGVVIGKGLGRTIITAYIPGGPSDQCVVGVLGETNSAFVELPDELEIIEEEAFYGTQAERIHIKNNCRSIGASAFADSSSLRYVYIPASVIEISPNAFDGDSNLCIICSSNSAAEAYANEHSIDYQLDETAAFVPVRSITMPGILEIDVEESAALNAVILPETASNKAILWSSSNTDVAVVSADGVVTGVGDGTAVITAEADGGNKTATCTVTVKYPNVKVSADINLNLQEIGSKNAKLSADLTLTGAEADRVRFAGVVLYDVNKEVLMTQMDTPQISNEKISVTVDLKNDCDYSVTPVTTYYYRYAVNVSGIMFYSEYLSFTTEAAPPEIVLSNDALTLGEGESATITAHVLYSEDQDIIWRSSNTSVAYVIDGRVVTQGKGTAVITAILANDTSVKATCTITVVGEI